MNDESRPVSRSATSAWKDEAIRMRRGMIALFDRNAKIEAAAREVVIALEAQITAGLDESDDLYDARASLKEALGA